MPQQRRFCAPSGHSPKLAYEEFPGIVYWDALLASMVGSVNCPALMGDDIAKFAVSFPWDASETVF